jgi:hypothetical protein
MFVLSCRGGSARCGPPHRGSGTHGRDGGTRSVEGDSPIRAHPSSRGAAARPPYRSRQRRRTLHEKTNIGPAKSPRVQNRRVASALYRCADFKRDSGDGPRDPREDRRSGSWRSGWAVQCGRSRSTISGRPGKRKSSAVRASASGRLRSNWRLRGALRQSISGAKTSSAARGNCMMRSVLGPWNQGPKPGFPRFLAPREHAGNRRRRKLLVISLAYPNQVRLQMSYSDPLRSFSVSVESIVLMGRLRLPMPRATGSRDRMMPQMA